MSRLSLLRDDDVEPLTEGVCTLLEDVGVLCQNEEMLRALEQTGARADHSAERVTFPRKMTAAFAEDVRAEMAGTDETAEPGPEARFAAPGLPGVGGQVAQFFYDYEAREQRSGNTRDLIYLTKLGDVLHGEGGVGHSLLLTDVPPLMEPLEAAMILAEYAHTPGRAFAWNVKLVDYLREMGEILGIEDWFSWGANCFAHPLRFDRDVADKFVRRVREGVASGWTAMPVAGLSTPVTVEGFVVVSSAEHVATWMAARALNPQVGLTGSMWPGTVDMATGHVSYCCFDAMFYGFATVEFLGKWCGVDVKMGGGEYCDAKLPGLYAAYEKAYKAMTIAAFTGYHPGVGSGMLDEGKILAPVQLMLERDVGLGVRHFGREIEATAENITLPTMRDVGLGLQRNYLETEHTLRNFRECLWLPELIDRSGWNGAANEDKMLRKAHSRAESLVGEYTKPEGREEKLVAMREVVERARKHLLE
ncbi:MAG: trimethylamine methyltransferase family protein [Armatimonadota bacterium]